LIPRDDEISVNNSASGLNCLQKIYSRIWNGEFPSSWNEASIISIPKKGDDLSDYDNYRGIFLINNCIKLISKIFFINVYYISKDLNIPPFIFYIYIFNIPSQI